MVLQAEQILSLDDLQGVNLPGYLFFTNAGPDTKNGRVTDIEQFLLQLGFENMPGDNPDAGLYWFSCGDQEMVRYHPIPTHGDPRVTRTTTHFRMQTRVNFFYTTTAYDVAKCLLDSGHQVMLIPLDRILNKLFHVTSDDGNYIVTQVELQ